MCKLRLKCTHTERPKFACVHLSKSYSLSTQLYRFDFAPPFFCTLTDTQRYSILMYSCIICYKGAPYQTIENQPMSKCRNQVVLSSSIWWHLTQEVLGWLRSGTTRDFASSPDFHPTRLPTNNITKNHYSPSKLFSTSIFKSANFIFGLKWPTPPRAQSQSDTSPLK